VPPQRRVGLFIACLCAVIFSASGWDREFAGAFDHRLQILAGKDAAKCGHIPFGKETKEAYKCVRKSFAKRKPFYVKYDQRGMDSDVEHGLAGSRSVHTSPEELNRWLGRESAGELVQIATESADLSSDLKRGLAFLRKRGNGDNKEQSPPPAKKR
jgi:hypothetical protein